MLSTPHKRFRWGRADRLADLTFFRALLIRRQRPPRIVKEGDATPGASSTKYRKDTRWKTVAWTPWLWVK